MDWAQSCRPRRRPRHARGHLRRRLRLRRRAAWTCDAVALRRVRAADAVVPQHARSANVEACVDDFYTAPTRSTHFIAAWQHVAERLAELARGDRLRPAQRAELGHVLRSSTSSAIGSRRSTTTSSRAVRAAAPRLGRVPRAELEPQRRHRDRRCTPLPFDDVDVRAALVRLDGRERQRLRSVAPPEDPRQRRASSPARRRRCTPACGSASTAASPTTPGIVDYMTAQYDAAGAVAGRHDVLGLRRERRLRPARRPTATRSPMLVDARRAAVSRARRRHADVVRVRRRRRRRSRSRTRPIASSTRRPRSSCPPRRLPDGYRSTAAAAPSRRVTTRSSSPKHRPAAAASR